MMDFTDYQDLFDKYDTMKKISFDYAVAEHESKIQVVRFAGMWKDLGTWNTLTEAMDESIIGKGELNDKCSGVHIINEMDVPVLAMGLHDVVISASPEGILVSDKEQSSYIKPFVDKFEQQIMFAEKLINTERRQTVHYRADRMAFRVLLCMDGCGTISYDEGTVNFYKGDCVFVPADSEVLTIHGQAQFLDIRG